MTKIWKVITGIFIKGHWIFFSCNMFFTFEELDFFYDKIFMKKKCILTHGSHLLFRNESDQTYKQMQVTLPSGRKVRYYVHQVIILKKLNVLSMENGFETSHLCHIKNCINPDHLTAEPHQINNSRIHCSRERNDCGDMSYCCGHDPYPLCIAQN